MAGCSWSYSCRRGYRCDAGHLGTRTGSVQCNINAILCVLTRRERAVRPTPLLPLLQVHCRWKISRDALQCNANAMQRHAMQMRSKHAESPPFLTLDPVPFIDPKQRLPSASLRPPFQSNLHPPHLTLTLTQPPPTNHSRLLICHLFPPPRGTNRDNHSTLKNYPNRPKLRTHKKQQQQQQSREHGGSRTRRSPSSVRARYRRLPPKTGETNTRPQEDPGRYILRKREGIVPGPQIPGPSCPARLPLAQARKRREKKGHCVGVSVSLWDLFLVVRSPPPSTVIAVVVVVVVCPS